ncbi:MAG TPA: hypothetical protein VN513_03555, partial [Gemmatimonadales bacterium]|nr:hypothetical protein [Gemmatimonadales bacterium]
MRFADDGILRNSQAAADFGRGETFVPELAQLRDGDVGPPGIVLHLWVLLFSIPLRTAIRRQAAHGRPTSGSILLPSVPPNGVDGILMSYFKTNHKAIEISGYHIASVSSDLF